MSGRSLRRTKLKSTLNGPLRTSASSQVEITTTSNLQCSFLALTVANYGFNILYPKRDRASHQNVEHVTICLCWIDGKSKTNSKIILKAELTLINADQHVLDHVILKPNAVAGSFAMKADWSWKPFTIWHTSHSLQIGLWIKQEHDQNSRLQFNSAIL